MIMASTIQREWKAGNNGGSDRRNLIALDYQTL